MKQFYGSLAKEDEETIVVKETTKESFETMVDFLYWKEIDCKVKTVEDLFNIAYMAEKYRIDAMTESVKKALRSILLMKTML